jgi:hypothetical protein
VVTHSHEFRTSGGGGNGASGRCRGATDSTRSGELRRFGQRGGRSDHWQLRGGHGSFPSAGRSRSRSGRGEWWWGRRRIKREEGGLKFLSCQCLARDGVRAQLSPPTRTS